VKFDSIDVLIYGVGLVDLQERGGYSKFGSGSYRNSDIAYSNFNSNNLTGNFINMIFEDSNGNRRILTNHKMTIIRATFLRGIFKLTKKRYLLYSIYDRDTNGDGKFNRKDLEAIYISNIDGTNFQKISSELHEFYDYQTLKNDSKLYFRTLEDINKDGKLNNKDKFHYYTIDFGKEDYQIDEYNPLDAYEK
jgi:hypothetical protein